MCFLRWISAQHTLQEVLLRKQSGLTVNHGPGRIIGPFEVADNDPLFESLQGFEPDTGDAALPQVPVEDMKGPRGLDLLPLLSVCRTERHRGRSKMDVGLV